MAKIDIALNDSAGYYDISFTNGDFTLTRGFDTALLMSLFCEKRANDSEISFPELQRGWWGNLFSDVLNYEMGSKLWLLEQTRNTQNNLNKGVTYAEEGCSWFVEDNFVDRVVVSGELVSNGIKLLVQFYHANNIIGTYAYGLWQNTGIFNAH